MNKKRISRIASLLIAAVLILSALSGCGPSGGNTTNSAGNGGKGSAGGSKNAYGFTSDFEDSAKEENKLKNYPQVKEALLTIEKTLNAGGVSASRIAFDGGKSPRAMFYVGETGGEYTPNETIYVAYDTDQNSGAVTLYEIQSKVFDASKDAAVRKAVLAALDISDTERDLAAKIQGDEEFQTMQYCISCYKGTESLHPNMENVKTNSYEEYQKIYDQTKDFTYYKFKIADDPASNERQTSIYKYNREQRKPTAEGRNVDEYGLSFNVPEAMKKNPYTGILALWVYYTGEYDGSGSTNGIELGMSGTTLKDKDFQTFLANDSVAARTRDVSPLVTKKINGYTWYTCSNSRFYYYAAEFAGRAYEIEIYYTSVKDGVTIEDVLSLLEKTLFFE